MDAMSVEREEGPSWARPNWPISELDDANLGLDPVEANFVEKAVEAAKASGVADEATLRDVADSSNRAMMLIRTYRVRGHLAARLDPLGLSHHDFPKELTPEWHGFRNLDEEVWLCGALGFEKATIRQIVGVLQSNYCGTVGVEYMHINDLEERRFIQDRVEGKNAEIHFTPEGKIAILDKVIEGEQWEKFLARKYVGTKRFGLDGGESMIPALEAVIKYGGHMGVTEMTIGMAHRGRLNVLANVMGKPYRAIFHEFAGGATNPEDVGGSGDVKYHLGTSSDRSFDGNDVHLSLMPNPSHLEAVDPVVLGKTRAVMTIRGDKHGKTVLPILLHGDAAFAGQGVVAECLMMSGLPGYGTGGTIHFVINNQVGFTTSPQFARSSPYPSDIAKSIQAPILHVNGDDPEAVTWACKVAIEFRQTFGRDVVIDMWCYRRFGHNEGDEPSFTQPLMYAEIRQHPPISKVYADRLIEEGVISKDWIDQKVADFTRHLEEEFEAGSAYEPKKADWFGGRWKGLRIPEEGVLGRRNTDTDIDGEMFDKLSDILTHVPGDLHIHKTLGRILKAKGKTLETGEGIDWATGEALAFGSLILEGYGVRLSGQDSGRGTFSQRHAVWVDQDTGEKFIPLREMRTDGGPRFEVRDSPLSEYGVLGFEYGYSLADPKTLTLWEAQFGDFVNGAQIMIDQFISSGEAKWLRASGLVMLLPHGYEGQGPEHSSARPERFLQLCAEDNMQVCNITMPANYFHVLRRQVKRDFRKPLIIMTPKSLLRHKRAQSTKDAFTNEETGHFYRILSDPDGCPSETVKKVVLCSGKVAFDLMDKRDEAGIEDTQIIRIEQLYPFPSEPLVKRLLAMPNLESLTWCQEEPRNQGYWFFVREIIDQCLADAGKGLTTRYAGREPSASPATGLAKRHAAQQAALIEDALGL
ncbi:2-oxoglutarate dehydrogenase E1 component [Sphingomicrobium aestuariivivum]|uniref:2-oxoglutarate dehydrogenase E1 component n=1 Tax=Sphingomicrobium aestuariivivum TaxID=1582356 RepID=UPI001FD6FDB3|nr:2-oxoglutarate dehydrogenase E1 component [Sphingomicrobium aestuariivivum]MCJ8190618.1 2-oxoglutarate dehydrogenase E1 component [Sphingomicrobium aestuariivivum]